ncbi:MAG: hypothetical protein KAY32_17465 [Candidatus Eisenbacteria sp.]|nr:hypothetical protein [Candidatus Eisenbacteria bacterium]
MRSWEGEECILFTFGGWGGFLLDEYGDFVVGDSVLVHGIVEPGSMWYCGGHRQTIRVEAIQECRGFDFGCGTLVENPEGGICFDSWRYDSYFLRDWGGSQLGDTLRIYGSLDPNCISWCGGNRCIAVDSVTACPDSLTSVSSITWGCLKGLFQ